MKSFAETSDDGDYHEDVDDAEFDSFSMTAQNDIFGNSSSPWIDTKVGK